MEPWDSKDGKCIIEGTEIRNGELIYLVRTGNERGVDLLNAKAVEQRRVRDAENIKFWAKQNQVIAEQDARESVYKKNREDLDGFTDDMPAMQKARVVETLAKPVMHLGLRISRRDLIRQYVADGHLVVKKNGELVLMSPKDGSYLEQSSITKTGMLYASHLIRKKHVEPTGPNDVSQKDLDHLFGVKPAVNTALPVAAPAPAVHIGTGKNYPVQQRYAYYNKLLFDGSLPTIPITFGNHKNMAGFVEAKTMRSSLGIKFLVPNSLRMVLSTRFERTSEQQDAILIHEMIHVHFYAVGNCDEDHGSEFVAMAKQCSKIAGFTIPLKDDVSDLAPSNKSVRPYVVFLAHPQAIDGLRGYALFTANVLEKMPILEAVVSILKRRYGGVDLYKIASPSWSAFAAKTTVQRSPIKIKVFKESAMSKPLLDELQKDGELIAVKDIILPGR